MANVFFLGFLKYNCSIVDLENALEIMYKEVRNVTVHFVFIIFFSPI